MIIGLHKIVDFLRNKILSRRVVRVVDELSVIVGNPLYVVMRIVLVVGGKVKILLPFKIAVRIVVIFRYAVIGTIGNANIIEVGLGSMLLRMISYLSVSI